MKHIPEHDLERRGSGFYFVEIIVKLPRTHCQAQCARYHIWRITSKSISLGNNPHTFSIPLRSPESQLHWSLSHQRSLRKNEKNNIFTIAKNSTNTYWVWFSSSCPINIKFQQPSGWGSPPLPFALLYRSTIQTRLPVVKDVIKTQIMAFSSNQKPISLSQPKPNARHPCNLSSLLWIVFLFDIYLYFVQNQ